MAGQAYKDIGIFRSIWRHWRKQIVRLKPSAYETVEVPLVAVLREQETRPAVFRLEKREQVFKKSSIQHYFRLIDN